jgi:dihydroflavonol-4-reductase
MTTLLTGASGFVGSALLRQLIRAGHNCRILLRPESDRRNVLGLEAETVIGDLRDPKSLEKALAGCSSLFHVAADYRLWVKNPQEVYETNVVGTRNLMLAAAQAGVRKIVYTSSVATLGHREDGEPADEETPVRFSDMIGHYKRSKFLAEAEVRRLATEERLPIIIVNPSTPVGPRDIKPTPTGRMVLDAASGRMPAYVNTGLNLVHVDDVAVGHLQAYAAGVPGQRYILGGQNMTLKEILTQIAAITGKRPPVLRLPHAVIVPIAYFCEGWARMISGKEPRVSVTSARLAREKMFFSAQKAERALGFRPRPVREGLQEAVDWFRTYGYLRCP